MNKKLDWNDYLWLILSNHKDKDDNFTLTIGDWKKPSHQILPSFHSFMSMKLGDLRKFYNDINSYWFSYSGSPAYPSPTVPRGTDQLRGLPDRRQGPD